MRIGGPFWAICQSPASTWGCGNLFIQIENLISHAIGYLENCKKQNYIWASLAVEMLKGTDRYYINLLNSLK